MGAIDRDVVLVAEDRDRDLDLCPSAVLLAQGFGLGALQGPPRVAILLCELLRIGCPVIGDAALLKRSLLGLSATLFCCDRF